MIRRYRFTEQVRNPIDFCSFTPTFCIRPEQASLCSLASFSKAVSCLACWLSSKLLPLIAKPFIALANLKSLKHVTAVQHRDSPVIVSVKQLAPRVKISPSQSGAQMGFWQLLHFATQHLLSTLIEYFQTLHFERSAFS